MSRILGGLTLAVVAALSFGLGLGANAVSGQSGADIPAACAEYMAQMGSMHGALAGMMGGPGMMGAGMMHGSGMMDRPGMMPSPDVE